MEEQTGKQTTLTYPLPIFYYEIEENNINNNNKTRKDPIEQSSVKTIHTPQKNKQTKKQKQNKTKQQQQQKAKQKANRKQYLSMKKIQLNLLATKFDHFDQPVMYHEGHVLLWPVTVQGLWALHYGNMRKGLGPIRYCCVVRG